MGRGNAADRQSTRTRPRGQGDARVPLERVKSPAGIPRRRRTATSETYRVEVLYPLKIVQDSSRPSSRRHTRDRPPSITEGGNIPGLAGSKVKLAIELDRAGKRAWLELRRSRPPRRGRVRPPSREAAADDRRHQARRPSWSSAADQTYAVFAKAADGMELPENKYRIRVRQDEPPQVWFESPAEALEVHTLAEILMRIRVSDDYGLSRAGIMFEVNNEEEYPLLAQDFAGGRRRS